MKCVDGKQKKRLSLMWCELSGFFAWNRVINKFGRNVILTQFSSQTAISGFVPSRGTETDPATISAFITPVITEELQYLFEGSLDYGEMGMLVSSIDTTQDINTGDQVAIDSINYKVAKIIDWSELGNIKAITLKKMST